MRAFALASLALLLLAGCVAAPDAAQEAAPSGPFPGHVEEWDGATWGSVCVDTPQGCFGSHEWEDDAVEARIQVPDGASSAVLEVSWEAPDPRTSELRIHVTRSPHDTVVLEGPSPLRADLTPLLSGMGSITVTGSVAGLADLPAKAYGIQWYHATLTFG